MPAHVQYTIRGVPREVDRALRTLAHQRRLSLNRLLVEQLTDAALGAEQRRYRSLKDVAGKWQKDREFDRVLAEQRRIDRNLWR